MSNGSDNYYRNANGTIIVREGGNALPWLVTWLPDDEGDINYPGFSLSSTIGEVPEGPSAEALLEWASRQPWANRATNESAIEEPAPAASVDVPVTEWADLQHKAFEQGVRLGFTPEPDGSFSWGVSSKEGELLQHGIADSWDDARLAMIENLHPASGEH